MRKSLGTAVVATHVAPWVLVRWECPPVPEFTESRNLRKSFHSVSVQPAHYHCPFSLQVNFVAAIDVYEDGEAGLLLCYNCK